MASASITVTKDTLTQALLVLPQIIKGHIVDAVRNESKVMVEKAQAYLNSQVKHPPSKILGPNIFYDDRSTGRGTEFNFIVYVDEARVPWAKYVEFEREPRGKNGKGFPGYHFMGLTYLEEVMTLESNIANRLRVSLANIKIWGVYNG